MARLAQLGIWVTASVLGANELDTMLLIKDIGPLSHDFLERTVATAEGYTDDIEYSAVVGMTAEVNTVLDGPAVGRTSSGNMGFVSHTDGMMMMQLKKKRPNDKYLVGPMGMFDGNTSHAHDQDRLSDALLEFAGSLDEQQRKYDQDLARRSDPEHRVDLLVEASLVGSCVFGETFDLKGATSMWVDASCAGIFSVNGLVTVCDGTTHVDGKRYCAQGEMAKPSAQCGLIFLTSFFTQKEDFQYHKKHGYFIEIKELYLSTMLRGMNVTIFYDGLSSDLIRRYECDNFQFVKVDLGNFDTRIGVNDVRFFVFNQFLQEYRSSEYVFNIDAFDVKVGMNPCAALSKDQGQKLYVGSEYKLQLEKFPGLDGFRRLGEPLVKWQQALVDKHLLLLNAGIAGGSRAVMTEFYNKMQETLSIPLQTNDSQPINADMAAFNYVVHTFFPAQFVTGSPVHSKFTNFEKTRHDVWLIHK